MSVKDDVAKPVQSGDDTGGIGACGCDGGHVASIHRGHVETLCGESVPCSIADIVTDQRTN